MSLQTVSTVVNNCYHILIRFLFVFWFLFFYYDFREDNYNSMADAVGADCKKIIKTIWIYFIF